MLTVIPLKPKARDGESARNSGDAELPSRTRPPDGLADLNFSMRKKDVACRVLVAPGVAAARSFSESPNPNGRESPGQNISDVRRYQLVASEPVTGVLQNQFAILRTRRLALSM
ncbi:MAG: hypothetical protein ACXW1R_07960 [Halobacteriota archaeon]